MNERNFFANISAKMLLFVFFTALYSLNASAIEQDADGFYLIGSVDDWKAFSEIVNTSPDANAKMTADVNLGDDQTKISDPTSRTSAYTLGSGVNFSGIFDGQGHTLTVNYTAQPNKSSSPFSHINGATIKNLHIAGSIVSATQGGCGISSACAGNNIIERVWVSANITAYGNSWNLCAAFTGAQKSGTVTIRDCLFTGTITCSQGYNGCFIGGYIDSGSATISNSLSLGKFNYTGSSNAFKGTYTNCYVVQFTTSIPVNMQCTEEGLADGTITTSLQAEREETIWVQDPVTNMPRLYCFTGEQITNIVDMVNASHTNNKAVYNISGQRIGNSYRGIVVKDGKKVLKK